jgi:hypothetical protein
MRIEAKSAKKVSVIESVVSSSCRGSNIMLGKIFRRRVKDAVRCNSPEKKIPGSRRL